MPEKKLPYPVTSRGKGDVATALLGLWDAFQQMDNERLLAEGKKAGAPRSMEEVTQMLAFDQPFTDIRFATGPQEGERHWSPSPGLNYPPDDISLRQISPLVQLDPETGMLYAVPPFAAEGRSGINYADYATERGMAVPGFREDIVLPAEPGRRPRLPAPPSPSLLEDLARLLGIGAADGSR